MNSVMVVMVAAAVGCFWWPQLMLIHLIVLLVCVGVQDDGLKKLRARVGQLEEEVTALKYPAPELDYFDPTGPQN